MCIYNVPQGQELYHKRFDYKTAPHTEEHDRISELINRLPEHEPADLNDAAYGSVANLDWSYYHYNEVDVTLGFAMENYQVLRMFAVAIEDDHYAWTDARTGDVHYGTWQNYTDYCEEHDIDENLTDVSGDYEFTDLGEHAQFWLNCETGNITVRMKLEKGWQFMDYEGAKRILCGAPHKDVSVCSILWQRGFEGIFNDADEDYYDAFDETYFDFVHNLMDDNNAMSIMQYGGLKLYMQVRRYDEKRYQKQLADWNAKHNDHLPPMYKRKPYRNTERSWMLAVRTARRQKYMPTDKAMWYDLVDALINLHMDTDNPALVCPANLRVVHDKWTTRYRMIEERNAMEQKRRTALKHKEDFEAFIAPYQGIHISTDKFDIFPCPNVYELIREATKMHNCVAGYADTTVHKNALILFCRDKWDARIATIELNTKSWKIIQTQGICNTVPCFNGMPCREEINDIILANLEQFKRATRKAVIIPLKQASAPTTKQLALTA